MNFSRASSPTSIEGSTRLLTSLGSRYEALLADHRKLLRTAFSSHQGIGVDTQGDALFYAFSKAHDAVTAGARATARTLWVPKTQSGLSPGPLGAAPRAPGEVLRGSLTSRLRAVKSQPEVEKLETPPRRALPTSMLATMPGVQPEGSPPNPQVKGQIEFSAPTGHRGAPNAPPPSLGVTIETQASHRGIGP